MKPGAVLLLVVALVGSGCVSRTDPPAEPDDTGRSTSAGPPEPAYDPPREFASEGVPIGNGRVAVADGVAYSYSDTGLVATELATGSRRWSVPLPDASELVTLESRDGVPPGVVTDGDGRTLVVGAYFRTVEGTGTRQDSEHTQVVAVDTAGEVVWEAAVAPAAAAPQVVGVLSDDRGVAVVLDVGDTVVLDAASGDVRWSGQGVTPVGVDGDAVIGLRAGESATDPWTTVALRGGDGAQLWAGPALEGGTAVIWDPPEVVPAGPGRAIVSGAAGFESATIVIDTATGAEVARVPEFLHCLFDDRDTAVCSDAPPGELPYLVVGLDVASGRQLWQLPTDDRTAVSVTAAFHGAVYGDATRTSVVLDARTGADLESDAAIAPTQVLPGYGIVTEGFHERESVAHRATG